MYIIMRISAYLYILLLLATAPYELWAQASCGQNLAHAQQLYDEGKLQQVPLTLAKCIKSGFTQEERIKAYRLLTLTYLFTNDLQKADEIFAKLLRLSPDFSITKESDPAALVQLYKSYRTSPVCSFSLLLGPNQTMVRRSQVHGIGNTEQEQGEYNTKIGFQVGLGANLYLSKRISVQAQVMSSTRLFTFKNQLLGYANLDYEEKQRLIEVPINIQYHFGNKKVLPYIFIGAKYQNLSSADVTIARQQDLGKDVEVNGLDITSVRRNQNFELQFGLGVQYRIKRMGLFIQGSFGSGVFEQPIADKRYSIRELAYRYGYVDDDFATDHISIEVGVSYSIYNPKKLKNKKFEAIKEAERLSTTN